MTLIGPNVTPHDFGMQENDLHLIVNDQSETCKVFKGDGVLLREWAALARGQGGDTEWTKKYTDTPPGLWIVTKIYRDRENPGNTSYRDKIAYGWYSFAMKGLENQETHYGRSGIMLHGGGSSLGAAGWDHPYQSLTPTLGCIRLRNAHTKDLCMLADNYGGDIYISVYQEGK